MHEAHGNQAARAPQDYRVEPEAAVGNPDWFRATGGRTSSQFAGLQQRRPAVDRSQLQGGIEPRVEPSHAYFVAFLFSDVKRVTQEGSGSVFVSSSRQAYSFVFDLPCTLPSAGPLPRQPVQAFRSRVGSRPVVRSQSRRGASSSLNATATAGPAGPNRRDPAYSAGGALGTASAPSEEGRADILGAILRPVLKLHATASTRKVSLYQRPA